MYVKNLSINEAVVIETSDGPVVILFDKYRGGDKATVKVQAPRECHIEVVDRSRAENVVDGIKATGRMT